MLKKNIPLLKRLRTRFLRMRHPEHFKMEVIAEKTACGSAMCIIGHVLDLSGFKMRIVERKEDDWRKGFIDFDFISPAGRRVDSNRLQLTARRLLGMERYDADDLFQDYSLQTPAQAAARIAELID